MQTDGNLVLYAPYETALWSSVTGGHPGAYLAVQNDGNLVVYEGPKSLWSSGTVDPNAPTPPPDPVDAGPTEDGAVDDAGNPVDTSGGGGCATSSSRALDGDGALALLMFALVRFARRRPRST